MKIVSADWTTAKMSEAIERVKYDVLAKEVERPGKLEIGVKWTVWDTKWENYLGSLQGALGILLDYVVRRYMPVTWNPTTDAANKHECLKYQALMTGPSYETDRMTVCGELKACCLDSEGWACIKRFDRQKDGRLAMEGLRAHYKVVGEYNKPIAWETATIENAHYRSEHNYSFENFSTGLY